MFSVCVVAIWAVYEAALWCAAGGSMYISGTCSSWPVWVWHPVYILSLVMSSTFGMGTVQWLSQFLVCAGASMCILVTNWIGDVHAE